MKKEIILLELFSGTGGFAKGFLDAGFIIKRHLFSEVDKHAIANYKYNFKDAEYIGSVTNVRHIIRIVNEARQSGTRLIITFGSPCQDFSMAGLRTGLEGSKSSLIKYALVLIKWLRPDVYIWENVKGAYSSNNGADYWAIIKAFADIDGYRREQQLLNTSWVLPQNRERIYFIGHLTGRSEPGVFPITESFGRDDERRQEYDTPIIRTLTAGGHSGGQHSGMTLVRHRSTAPFNHEDTAPTLRNSDKGEVRIVAQRGRNPENPSDRTTGIHTEQRLEVNNNGTTNTLTGVQKDNMVLISKPGHGRSKGESFENICPTLLNHMGTGGDNVPYVNNIRRLTEIECERLQGFPDNWTEYGDYDGTIKKIPKTQRYNLMGNAVTTTIVKLQAQRIQLI